MMAIQLNMQPTCNMFRVDNGYPLAIENITLVQYEETEFKESFVLKMLGKLDLGTILSAWQQLAPFCKQDVEDLPEGRLVELPATESELRAQIGLMPMKVVVDSTAAGLKGGDEKLAGMSKDEDGNGNGDDDKINEELRMETLKTLHSILLDIHVMEGELKCPATQRIFPIRGGIPNMILHADEI
jgi:uncharacterized protein YbaR (Trm112 family)